MAAKIKEITLLELYSECNSARQLVCLGEKYLPLGQNEEGHSDFLCLKESTSEVFYLQDVGGTTAEASFVNSSLKLHFYFWLLMFQNYVGKAFTILQKERAQAVRTLFSEFKRLDKAALVDENSYWSVLLEQIGDRML